jgi:hypothetical protein
MKLVRQIFSLSLALSLVSLTATFLGKLGWVPIFIGLAIGLQWAFMVWKGWKTLPFSFLGLLALLVYGAASYLPAGWLLGSLVMLLVAWDLSEFSEHLERFDPERVDSKLVHNHILRLFYVAGMGLGLGGLALAIKVRLGFGIAVLLGLLVFVGLAGAVRFLRRSL